MRGPNVRITSQLIPASLGVHGPGEMQMRSGLSLSAAYYRALLFTGRVVMLTGVTLAVGVVTWVLSPIKFQADMGLLLAFMFVWNMLGALILVPALAHFLLLPARQLTANTEGFVRQSPVT